MSRIAATILLVDDEIQNRRLLEALLQPEGYLTVQAANGEEALASVAERAPDLILLDAMMPGMDGYQVARKLKSNPDTSRIPIIIVTAQVERSARLSGLDAGAEDLLTKPVDRAELWLRVRNLLRLKTLSDFFQNHSSILEAQVQTRTAGLQASELRFRQMAESIQDVFFLLDADGRVLYVSPAYEEISGRTCESLYARPESALEAVHPDDRERAEKMNHRARSGPDEFLGRIVRPDGSIRWIETRGFPVHEGGVTVRIAGTAKDITSRKRADDALLASLLEKEALLKEVHHRVKNNMQVISSLLRLESSRIEHPMTKTVLKAMQHRIQAMSLLHEFLYRSDSLDRVNLGAYLKKLSEQLGRSLSTDSGHVVFHCDVDSVKVGLDLDQAIPCGLIVNELVSNSLKHAFPAGRSGEVRVELHRVAEGDQIRLRVVDDGVGLPEEFEAKRTRSLGLQLVSDLARQLNGRLEIAPGPPTLFDLIFKPSAQGHGPRTERLIDGHHPDH